MKSVPVFEAKNRFSELLALVEAGEEIAITRRGTPVARLVAANPDDANARRTEVAEIFEQLRQLRSGFELGDELKQVAREGLD